MLDYLQIINLLNLTINDSERVRDAIAAAENYPNVEAVIATTITNLQTICDLINAERSSPNSALIRADVLEWSEGERSTGMLARKRELQQQLANLLGLTWTLPSYPGGAIVLDTRTLI